MRELGQRLLARALENIDAQIDRRAGGERRAFRSRVIAEDSLQPRLEPLRKVAANMRRRVSKESPSRSLSRSCAVSGGLAWPSPENSALMASSVVTARLAQRAKHDRAGVSSPMTQAAEARFLSAS